MTDPPHRSCHVEPRFGDRDLGHPPSDDEILDAIIEVLDEASVLEQYPDLEEGDLQEHPNAWIQVHEEGRGLSVLDLYRGGRLEYRVYDNPDSADPIRHSALHGVTASRAAALWAALRDNRLHELDVAFQ